MMVIANGKSRYYYGRKGIIWYFCGTMGIICRINIKKLVDFDPEIQSLWGFTIGEYMVIPFDELHQEYYHSDLVEVTGFNPEHDIIHWSAPSRFGGIGHSGTDYRDCKKL